MLPLIETLEILVLDIEFVDHLQLFSKKIRKVFPAFFSGSQSDLFLLQLNG